MSGIPVFDFTTTVDPILLITAVLGAVAEDATPGLIAAHRTLLRDLAEAMQRGPLGTGRN